MNSLTWHINNPNDDDACNFMETTQALGLHQNITFLTHASCLELCEDVSFMDCPFCIVHGGMDTVSQKFDANQCTPPPAPDIPSLSAVS